MTLPDFGNAAQKLAKNPLGIIALFIVLLYAIAGLVLDRSLSQLSGPIERLPLIFFIVIFPFAVLGVFGWLVSKHHKKLYAPSDFKSDDAFLQALSLEDQRERLELEVEELAEPPANEQLAEATDPAGQTDVPIDTAIDIRTIDLRNDVVLAEDLVMRALGSEFGLAIRRQVVVTGDGVRLELDGIVYEKSRIKAIEVKFINERFMKRSRATLIHRLRQIADTLQSISAGGEVSVLLAFVGRNMNALSHEIRARYQDLPSISVDVEFRYYDFDELQRTFGVAELR